jgi:L-threonylcarbamoyladenylate synthase
MYKKNINHAIKFLKEGNLVCFPTETVYGLGADATNDSAILKIYKTKNRPANNPLIIHTYSIDSAKKIAIFNDDANKLSVLWPGPLTLVMQQKNNAISINATNNLKTIAIRIPSHPLCHEILKEFGGYIAAPSANPSGYISSTKFEHVMEHYGSSEEIYIFDEDDCVYGIESTIIDVSNDEPVMLRHGFIEEKTIEKLLGKKIIQNKTSNIIAPGMLDKHYSPYSKIRLNAEILGEKEVGIGFGKVNGMFEMNLSTKGDLKEAAFNLYDLLRKSDKIALQMNKSIAISPIPNKDLGVAINDKLRRAEIK